MNEQPEPLSTRVVRIVYQVQPRWLTAKSVCEACPDDRSDLVYSTLNNYASGAKSPLIKRRSDGGSGAVEYTTREGFNLDGWISERTKQRRRPPGDDNLDTCVRIVQTLRQYPRRLTAVELESTGRFPDRKGLLVNLAQLCDEGEPLARDRRANTDGDNPPFEYGLKPAFNIEAWLEERGASLDLLVLGEAPPLPQPQPLKAALVRPIPKVVAPQAGATLEETSKPKGRDRAGSASPPAAAATRPGARVVHGRDTADDDPPTERRPTQSPAANDRLSLASPLPAPAAAGAAAAFQGTAVAPETPKAQAMPTPHADRAPASPSDLSTELVIIAAACLAVTVRLHVTGIKECADLARALDNFEAADRAYVRARGSLTPSSTGQQRGRAA